METVELAVDVTDAVNLGEPAKVAVTVHFPDPGRLPSRPVVCFAKPGTGFARGYFTSDLPGPAEGAQSAWHVQRGWVFVSVDHLGVGGSSTHEMTRLDHRTLAAAAHAAEQEILEDLAKGTLRQRFPALADPLVVGLGQSLGGGLTVFQQAHHHTYHGIAILGYGVLDMQVPVRPGDSPMVVPWMPRDDYTTVLNADQVAAAGEQDYLAKSFWFWFCDDVDVDASVVSGMTGAGGPAHPWLSKTIPGVMLCASTPGVVFSEAAAIDVPVLLGFGERDVCADQRGETRAYRSAPSVDLFVCPRMGHMHNFAGTRELLWERIDNWAVWVGRSLQAN